MEETEIGERMSRQVESAVQHKKQLITMVIIHRALTVFHH